MHKPDFVVTDFIYDANTPNFEALVLENSKRGPVLVHFWSPRAGPSFRLYPILENLVTDYRGSFLLVNLNVDDNTSVAREYAITSIPTLKLFVNQQVLETLYGYQSPNDLKFMLDQYVASENDQIIQQALALYQQGEIESAYQQLGKAALTSPNYYKLPLTIATLMFQQGRIDEALALLRSMPEMVQQKLPCKRLLITCEFARIAAAVSDVEQLKPFVAEHMQELPAVYLLAAWYATQREYTAALELFHHIYQQDKNFEDRLAQRSILKVLSLLPEHDPQLKFYRNILRQD